MVGISFKLGNNWTSKSVIRGFIVADIDKGEQKLDFDEARAPRCVDPLVLVHIFTSVRCTDLARICVQGLSQTGAVRQGVKFKRSRSVWTLSQGSGSTLHSSLLVRCGAEHVLSSGKLTTSLRSGCGIIEKVFEGS